MKYLLNTALNLCARIYACACVLVYGIRCWTRSKMIQNILFSPDELYVCSMCAFISIHPRRACVCVYVIWTQYFWAVLLEFRSYSSLWMRALFLCLHFSHTHTYPMTLAFHIGFNFPPILRVVHWYISATDMLSIAFNLNKNRRLRGGGWETEKDCCTSCKTAFTVIDVNGTENTSLFDAPELMAINWGTTELMTIRCRFSLLSYTHTHTWLVVNLDAYLTKSKCVQIPEPPNTRATHKNRSL